MKRTHLPLNALRVYDAAARHLSFTRAADELAVTPAAVGQQIRALEDVLGVVLFRRLPTGLELTPEGASGLDALRHGFEQFEESVRAMRAGQASSVLTLAAPRAVIAHWLLPRLVRHSEALADVRLVLEIADSPPDFAAANLDLAIVRMADPGEWESVALDEGEEVGLTSIGGTADGPIDWRAAGEGTLSVADPGLALDAALAGLGHVIVPRLLAQDALDDGKARLSGSPASGERHWLAAPLPQWRQTKVRRMVEVLTR